MNRIRTIVIVLVALAASGCCGTFLYQPSTLPEPVSFEVRAPTQVSLPADQGTVAIPLELTNTSAAAICIAGPEAENNRRGLLVRSVLKSSASLLDDKASGFRTAGLKCIKVGRADKVAPDRQFALELKLSAGTQPGSVGEARAKISLIRPDKPGPQATVDWPIEIKVAAPGVPPAIGAYISYSSENQETSK